MTPSRFFVKALMNFPVRTGFMFVMEIAYGVFTLLLPFVVKDLVDVLSVHEAGQDIWVSVGPAFQNFMWVCIAIMLTNRMSGTCVGILAPWLRVKPRLLLVDRLQSHSMNFFQDRFGGALGNKINESLSGMAFALWQFTFDVLPVMVKAIVGIVLLFMAHQLLGWTMLFWVVVYTIVCCFAAYYRAIHAEHLSEERSVITGYIVDLASNIQSVKSFANEKHERKRIEQSMGGEIHHSIWFGIWREGMGWFHSLMVAGILLLVLHMAVNSYAANALTIGEVAFIFTLLFLVTDQMGGLLWAVANFLENTGQMSDGVKTIMVKKQMQDRPDACVLRASTGTIALRNVDFTYPEQPDKPVLQGFDLIIPAGQKVGLVGHSGAGKTTLANLLLRFYDIQSGSIAIDGQDIASVTQESLRQSIAVIPQDTSLFHRSLMDNIRYGRLDASDDAVIAAAKQAFADEFITQLPNGYHTMVGERGLKLSGGQRQRIAIARAVLKDAPILVLDEATSALDSESEQKIQESLQTLMQNKTVIAIAHRLSTIAHLDRLIIMQNGQIVEDGTHDELLAQEGAYAHLWSMQSGGFLQ